MSKTVGIITKIDPQKGLVYVSTEYGTSIFELLSGNNIDEGDKISWKENFPLGDCEIFNITKEEKQEVYFQNH